MTNNYSTQPPKLMTLAELPFGKPATISQITSSLEQVQRLKMMGIRKGVNIMIVHGPSHRGVVIKVGGARIAIGTELLPFIKIIPANTEVKSS